MTRGVFLSAMFVLLAAPAFAAQSTCVEPTLPKLPEGRRVPESEFVTARAEVIAYVQKSDDYQLCLKEQIDFLEMRAKEENRPVDEKLKSELLAMGDANQAKKEKLGADYTAAYRQAHGR
jgi:hypothetical protein